MASEQTKIPERTEKNDSVYFGSNNRETWNQQPKIWKFSEMESLALSLYFLDFINGLNCFMFVIWYWPAYERIELLLHLTRLIEHFLLKLVLFSIALFASYFSSYLPVIFPVNIYTSVFYLVFFLIELFLNGERCSPFFLPEHLPFLHFTATKNRITKQITSLISFPFSTKNTKNFRDQTVRKNKKCSKIKSDARKWLDMRVERVKC